jgi:hypothetical protein
MPAPSATHNHHSGGWIQSLVVEPVAQGTRCDRDPRELAVDRVEERDDPGRGKADSPVRHRERIRREQRQQDADDRDRVGRDAPIGQRARRPERGHGPDVARHEIDDALVDVLEQDPLGLESRHLREARDGQPLARTQRSAEDG